MPHPEAGAYSIYPVDQTFNPSGSFLKRRKDVYIVVFPEELGQEPDSPFRPEVYSERFLREAVMGKKSDQVQEWVNGFRKGFKSSSISD